MSLFEFIVGMVSIIMALAVAQLFVGITELMQQRARVKYFLPHSIWVLDLFLMVAWCLASENPPVHLAISVAVLLGLSAIALIRFVPGQ